MTDEPNVNAESDVEGQELPYTTLAHFSNSADAGMVHELLLNNGVRAVLQGNNFGSLDPLPLPGGFSEIELMVAEPDLARAQELYDAFFAHPTGDLSEAEGEAVEGTAS